MKFFWTIFMRKSCLVYIPQINAVELTGSNFKKSDKIEKWADSGDKSWTPLKGNLALPPEKKWTNKAKEKVSSREEEENNLPCFH